MTVLSDDIRIGVTGHRRHGKDSVANRLVKRWGFVRIELPAPLTEELCIINPWCHVDDEATRGWLGEWVRFADLVKAIGIDKAKDVSSDVRPYQQRYGTDVVRNRIDVDRWAQLAEDKMEEILATYKTGRFVLPNIRAKNEQNLCDGIIRVVRPGVTLDVEGDHEIEHGIDLINADCVILNDGSLEDLNAKVDEAIVSLIEVRPIEVNS